MTASDVLDGRFELQTPLGSGGMATVYRAWDRGGRRPCAVKVLADVLARDEESRRRFRHEAASAGALTHPHIVTVYGWGQDGLRQFIAMEYVSGGTLRERLQRDGRLPEADALRIAAEVADALAYAHNRHVVHRDIKPHNILLTGDGRVKVADFGIARTLDATSLTRTGTVLGSAPYLAPEQVRGEAAGPASDQYALGVVLYEMLAGRPPFAGEAPIAVALKHLNEAPPDLRAVRPEVSLAAASVVARLLAKVPAGRYPDAADLAAELHRLADGLSPRAAAQGEADATTRLEGLVPPGASRSQHRGSDAAVAATAQLSRDAVFATQHLPADGPGLRDGAGAAAGSELAAAARLDVSDTARLHLPRPGRSVMTGARVGVAAVSLGLALLILGAAYRAAWTAAHVAVPNLVGRTVTGAGQTAQQLRLGVLVARQRQDPKAPVGAVLAQDPPAGREVAKGTVISLVVSQGSGLVPDLTGQTVTNAAGTLERLGLRLGQVNYTADDHVPSGRIIHQFQAAGTHLSPNGGVDVLVSQGPPPFPFNLFPKLPGQDEGGPERDNGGR